MALNCEKIYVFKKVTEQMIAKLGDVKFRLVWGGEYLDFRFDESKKYILPEKGSANLLNGMFIVPYSIESFITLSEKASIFMVFGDNSLKEYANSVMIRWYKDYNRMIADLEDIKCLITEKSLNVLSVSCLRFLFTDPESIKKFGTTFYEFDSLGTTMFPELSKVIEILWVKRCSEEN